MSDRTWRRRTALKRRAGVGRGRNDRRHVQCTHPERPGMHRRGPAGAARRVFEAARVSRGRINRSCAERNRFMPMPRHTCIDEVYSKRDTHGKDEQTRNCCGSHPEGASCYDHTHFESTLFFIYREDRLIAVTSVTGRRIRFAPRSGLRLLRCGVDRAQILLCGEKRQGREDIGQAVHASIGYCFGRANLDRLVTTILATGFPASSCSGA